MRDVLLALPLGLMTGAMLGALGAGGSVLTVPALVCLLGQPVREATTAALVIVSADAAVGAVENARRGTIDLRLAAGFGSAGILGALAGSYLNSLVGGEAARRPGLLRVDGEHVAAGMRLLGEGGQYGSRSSFRASLKRFTML